MTASDLSFVGGVEEQRANKLLRYYTLFRFFIIAVFLLLHVTADKTVGWDPKFAQILIFYTFLAIFWSYILYRQRLPFTTHILFAGVFDIALIALLITIEGDLRSGFGVMLNVIVAFLSVMAPGRLAIFFASVASIMVLGISSFEYLQGASADRETFFMAGVHGAGFFATALTAWYLARIVEVSEDLAKQRNRELLSMQRLNEYIVERLQYGVIYVDSDKKIRLMNTAARSFFNVPKDRTILDIGDLSTQLEKKYEQYFQRAKYTSEVIQTAIESPYLRVHLYSASFAKQTAVLIILEDLSAISQEAQQLKLASLGRFSASIAHELRNPLGVISHAVQLLGEDEQWTGEDRRLKELIVSNCNRMNEVIKNVLQISRRNKAVPVRIHLQSFLQQFITRFCQTHVCEMSLKPSQVEMGEITFDQSQLEQVLVAIAENAIHHGASSDGKVRIYFEFQRVGGQPALVIGDEGPGIALEARESIFEPFFTTRHVGTGMGLFIARDLCEINQSRLTLGNASKGACFVIQFSHANENHYEL